MVCPSRPWKGKLPGTKRRRRVMEAMPGGMLRPWLRGEEWREGREDILDEEHPALVTFDSDCSSEYWT